MKEELLEWLEYQEKEIMRPLKLSGRPIDDYHLKQQKIITQLRKIVEGYFSTGKVGKKDIEAIENPFNGPSWSQDGFECCRQKVLNIMQKVDQERHNKEGK